MEMEIVCFSFGYYCVLCAVCCRFRRELWGARKAKEPNAWLTRSPATYKYRWATGGRTRELKTFMHKPVGRMEEFGAHHTTEVKPQIYITNSCVGIGIHNFIYDWGFREHGSDFKPISMSKTLGSSIFRCFLVMQVLGNCVFNGTICW